MTSDEATTKLAQIEKARIAFEKKVSRIAGCQVHVSAHISEGGEKSDLAQAGIRFGWELNTDKSGLGAWVNSPCTRYSIGHTSVWFAEPK
jgi:hypothetical protein